MRNNYFIKCALTVTFLIFFASCASAPPLVKKETPNMVLEISKPEYTMPKSVLYEEVEKQLSDFLNDSISKSILDEQFNTKTSNFSDPIKFSTIDQFTIEKASNELTTFLKNYIEQNKNQIHWMVGDRDLQWRCEQRSPVIFKTENNKLDSITGILFLNALFTSDCTYYSALTKRREPENYNSSLSLKIKFAENDSAILLIIEEITTNNTNGAFIKAQKNTEIIQNAIRNNVVEINKRGMDQFINLKSSIIYDTKIKLRKRYQVENIERIKKEKVYNVPFNVAVSRLQRKFESYKYSIENSTFTYNGKDSFKYADVNLDYINNLALKFFPETKNRTAIVFEKEFEPVFDSFKEQYIYGRNEALLDLENTIKNIEMQIN